MLSSQCSLLSYLQYDMWLSNYPRTLSSLYIPIILTAFFWFYVQLHFSFIFTLNVFFAHLLHPWYYHNHSLKLYLSYIKSPHYLWGYYLAFTALKEDFYYQLSTQLFVSKEILLTIKYRKFNVEYKENINRNQNRILRDNNAILFSFLRFCIRQNSEKMILWYNLKISFFTFYLKLNFDIGVNFQSQSTNAEIVPFSLKTSWLSTASSILFL